MIDLKSLLTNTNGLQNDTDGDLDGSEKRSYTFTGIPEGTIITIGANSVAAGADGKATINFPDNTKDDPEFTMTLAKHFSGQINGKITLNVVDTDSDSDGVISPVSASVNFTITVTPVIDTNLDASTVVATGTEDLALVGLANPLKVTITASGGTDALVITDKSETLGNIVLDQIPNGMTVWYMDGENLKMATNIGTSTGDYTLNPNGDKVNVGVNKWLIPTVGRNVIPEIYVNAPENWAGTFYFDVKLSVYEQNLVTPVEKTINTTGTITPVADGLTASGTKITKDDYAFNLAIGYPF